MERARLNSRDTPGFFSFSADANFDAIHDDGTALRKINSQRNFETFITFNDKFNISICVVRVNSALRYGALRIKAQKLSNN